MTTQLKKLDRLLVANRGEIAIRVLRAASELHIGTIALYTYEDRYSLHRYKADEAYQIGADGEALKPYIDIEEIISLAKRKNIDAIHPGYGFLSENPDFSRRCREEGIIFIGPTPETMSALGDKVKAKTLARELKIPVIEDSQKDLIDVKTALSEATRITYPVMLKAAAGGGGRGMRVVRNADELATAFETSKREAKSAFGDDRLFLEKFIEEPRHIEIQLLGDNFGNLVHLFERDCSVQRRFQKVVEVAPATSLKQEIKDKLYNYALAIGRHVSFNNAGTVEFLVDNSNSIYFIEVNPRIQVEHTVTEEITGVDLVRSQILIAKGHSLASQEISLANQSDIKHSGVAIQCRITTEDPANEFKPDYGRLIAYRSPGGFGIRLDGGSAYTGAQIPPYFDSLLVKITSHGRTLRDAAERMDRALREFRVRGVKTNIGFLENVVSHPKFLSGDTNVGFISNYPELLKIDWGQDRATRTLRFLADTIVNGNSDVKQKDSTRTFRLPPVPVFDKNVKYPEGSKDLLKKLGRNKFLGWIKKEKSIHYTDTTLRDAHQSLLATRVRTKDMIKIAESFARNNPQVFSMEVWGGATFDVALRFLHECPWDRLRLLREAVPNILFQMLLRGSNLVGYSAYPNNLIEKFIEKSWETGVDIFRIFDSMNSLPQMLASINAVRERTEGIAEVAICYTGDFLDPERPKYNLQYYLDLAKRVEDSGAHILCIKDMAGLLKPYAAQILIAELKKTVSLPIHLHTHDTSGIQAATYIKAIEAGVNIIDVALGAVSGLTSQPNFESIVAALRGQERELEFDLKKLTQYSDYWECVRDYYYPFESELKSGTAQVYFHEIPGGQYSNLRPQARGLGLEHKFEKIKENYVVVNKMLGDVIKVTPSSKVVGDFALYMTANDLSDADILSGRPGLSIPKSVKDFIRGELGQPYGGFPSKLEQAVLQGEAKIETVPSELLPAVNFDAEFKEFLKQFNGATFLDFLSWKMYPKVFEEYFEHLAKFGPVYNIPTPSFFYGLKPNEEIVLDISEGKTLVIKLVYVSEPNEDGFRTVSFRLNGQSRAIEVRDKSLKVAKVARRKAATEGEIGAPLQGKLSKVLVKSGAKVDVGTALFMIEAMKMESAVASPKVGTVKLVHINEGAMVEQDDLVIEIS